MAGLLILGGTIGYLVGVCWLVYLAWRDEKPLMACGIFWVGIILGPIYALNNFGDDKKIPLGLLVGGFLVRFLGVSIGPSVLSSATMPR